MDGDTQLKFHSRYASTREVLNEVMESFAKYAPPESVLVVKNHPMQNGIIHQWEVTLNLAQKYQLEDRVFYLGYGTLPELLKRSRGVVVVNSTVGLSALYHGVPTIALGEAVYNMKGLTHQGGLDSFWNNPQPPNAYLLESFRNYLMNHVLVNGSYYTAFGRNIALQGTIERLTRDATTKVKMTEPQYTGYGPDRTTLETPIGPMSEQYHASDHTMHPNP